MELTKSVDHPSEKVLIRVRPLVPAGNAELIMKRRPFVQRVAPATAVVSTFAAMPAYSAARVIGANNRVNLALIGCGVRGRTVMRDMLAAPNVALAAVCDVRDRRTSRSREMFDPHPPGFRDFRRVLEMRDVDAVLVGTPDHWHAIPTILACQAGKDVYVEKPLAHNIKEGRAMIEAARRYDRIVQMGTQHRSAPHYREVEEMVQSGEIGEVRYVRVVNYRGGGRDGDSNSPGRGQGSAPEPAESTPPEDIDWDMWLGPAPWVPYDADRLNFRPYYDYAGGFITDFGTHRLDSVHQVMRSDKPVSAMGVGGRFDSSSRGDTPDLLNLTCEYPGWVLSYEAVQLNSFGAGPRIPGGREPYRSEGNFDRGHGEAFYGTTGTIFTDRAGYEYFPARGGEPRSVRGRDCTDLHALNFIECIRSRALPSADVEIGHRSTIIPHLGNISYRVGGRKIHWDAEREIIVDDPEASALLRREARPPWNMI